MAQAGGTRGVGTTLVVARLDIVEAVNAGEGDKPLHYTVDYRAFPP